MSNFQFIANYTGINPESGQPLNEPAYRGQLADGRTIVVCEDVYLANLPAGSDPEAWGLSLDDANAWEEKPASAKIGARFQAMMDQLLIGPSTDEQ